MAARKLAQEVDKCFKKVSEGVAEFEAIYEKIEQSNNPAQKEKLEDNLKREIKKLQRLRDQIKTWAGSNDIKDKAPLLEHRRLIETQMEKFKAVEKAMKTKAYSKEGLSAAAKLDPKEQEKADVNEFLGQMIDDLEQQIEALEAESETLQATMKKGKNNTAKADRVSEIEAMIEQHKFHQGRMELIRRSIDNGRIDTRGVREIEENIRYYVSDNMNDDFVDDEELYEELGLDDAEDAFGAGPDNDKLSSQDTQSIQEDAQEPEASARPPTTKIRGGAALDSSSTRRPSSQLKSPLPTIATLQAPLPTISANGTAMKPASIPTRPAGEGLKYASAAAAAAAADKIGIAPLPPPPGFNPPTASPIPPVTVQAVQARSSAASAANSPIPIAAQPVSSIGSLDRAPGPPPSLAVQQDPTPAQSKAVGAGNSYASSSSSASSAPASSKSRGKAPAPPEPLEPSRPSKQNGVSNGFAAIEEKAEEDEESIYHLPSSLRDLVEAFETSKKRQVSPVSQASLRMLSRSHATIPEASEMEPRPNYQPDIEFTSTANYPQDPLPIFDSPALYSRIDPDTLFYVFYYKQGSYQQYLAAKALKDQSWRFHKQYQTWFQRHEEPKAITEEFEQGTYRFFDYESTWMNRRKADFKFHYKYLEDDV